MKDNRKILQEKMQELLTKAYRVVADVDLIRAEEIYRYSLLGFSRDEAEEEILSQYKQYIFDDKTILSDQIMHHKAMLRAFAGVGEDEMNGCMLIESLAGHLVSEGFGIKNDEIVNETELVKQFRDGFLANAFVEKLNSEKRYVAERKKSTPKHDLKSLQLIDLFANKEQYDNVMAILAEEKLIDPTTNIWVDKKKGNKVALVEIIKGLHGKGYYKDSKRPCVEEIAAICKNTFKHTVSINTIKRNNDFDISFIPCSDMLS